MECKDTESVCVTLKSAFMNVCMKFQTKNCIVVMAQIVHVCTEYGC